MDDGHFEFVFNVKEFERDHLYWDNLWRKLEYICQTRPFSKDATVSVDVIRVDFKAATDVVRMYKFVENIRLRRSGFLKRSVIVS